MVRGSSQSAPAERGAALPRWAHVRATRSGGDHQPIRHQRRTRALRGALVAGVLLYLLSPASARARSLETDRCLASSEPVLTLPAPEGRTVGCELGVAALDRPRRTDDLTAVLFTTEVWPEASTDTVLSADTHAAHDDYSLTAGLLRLTARVTEDPERVDAVVEVTNLTTCMLMLEIRFVDGGERVSPRWVMRVRAGRDGHFREPAMFDVPGLVLRTPLTDRTTLDEFAAEFTAHFVDCDRRLRRRFV